MGNRPRKTSKKAASAPSLASFVRGKALAKCPVCQLPEAVRAQLGPAASQKGFTRADQVEWLRTVVGAGHITASVLNAHFNGRHEAELEEVTHGAN